MSFKPQSFERPTSDNDNTFLKEQQRTKTNSNYKANSTTKSHEVEIAEHLFHLIPSNSRLRYCVDVGTRNGENFVDNTLITHSLLVSNDEGKKKHEQERDEREGGGGRQSRGTQGREDHEDENLIDNDCYRDGRDTWFGILMQPDARAFQSLYRIHRPLGNLCLPICPSIDESGGNGNGWRTGIDEERETESEITTLASILKNNVSDLPIDFDFLGLQEAGYSNYWILRGLLENESSVVSYRPKVVCVSFDNNRPSDVSYVPNRNNPQELPSLKALVELMSSHNYQLVARTSRCCFFSKREVYEGFLRQTRFVLEEQGHHQQQKHLPIEEIIRSSGTSRPWNHEDTITAATTATSTHLEQRQERESPKVMHQVRKINSFKTGREILDSSSNRMASRLKKIGGNSENKKMDKNLFFSELSNALLMTKQNQASTGPENRSETLGTKWLLQRRKMFLTTGGGPSNAAAEAAATMIPSKLEMPLQLKNKVAKSPLITTTLDGIESKMGAMTSKQTVTATSIVQAERNDNDDRRIVVVGEHSNRAGDPPESRDDLDDFVSSSENNPITITARDAIENDEGIVERISTDPLKTTVGSIASNNNNTNSNTSKSELGSRYLFPQIKMFVPQDPDGDTIVQKRRQEIESSIEQSREERRTDSRDYQTKTRRKSNEKDGLNGPRIANRDREILTTITHHSNQNKRQAAFKEEGFGYDTPGQNDNENHHLLLSPAAASGAIDLTAICDPYGRSSEEEKSDCAKRLVAELRRNGHAMVRGTSMPRFLCRDALYAGHLILHESNEAARSSCTSEKNENKNIQERENGIHLRGYSCKCTEQSGRSDLKDMVRKFRLGSEKGSTPNIWPTVGTLDEETDEYIRISLQTYHDNLHQVAASIARSIFGVLPSEKNTINNYPQGIAEPILSMSYENNAAHNPESSLLTVINCEHGTRHETGKPLVASHIDPNLLTIVLVDGGDCASFQHVSIEENWENAQLPKLMPNDPIFMVYAGESLRESSNGRIPSKPRRIIPYEGNEIVNGLLFSLMPSQTSTTYSSPLLNNEIRKDFTQEVQSPISRLTSELNDIDEVFQSYSFLENRYREQRDSEEPMDFTMESFARELEDARNLMRIATTLPSKPTDQVTRKSQIGCGLGGPEVVAGFVGPGMKAEEDITARTSRNHDASQLLGSPQLPIIIETKPIAKPPSPPIIRVDQNFRPVVTLTSNDDSIIIINNNNSLNRESVPKKTLLPVASPWNPPPPPKYTRPRPKINQESERDVQKKASFKTENSFRQSNYQYTSTRRKDTNYSTRNQVQLPKKDAFSGQDLARMGPQKNIVRSGIESLHRTNPSKNIDSKAAKRKDNNFSTKKQIHVPRKDINSGQDLERTKRQKNIWRRTIESPQPRNPSKNDNPKIGDSDGPDDFKQKFYARRHHYLNNKSIRKKDVVSQTNNEIAVKQNDIISGTEEEKNPLSSHMKETLYPKPTPITGHQIDSIKSSDASAILDKMLGDAGDIFGPNDLSSVEPQIDPEKTRPGPPSISVNASDPFFRSCRESLSKNKFYSRPPQPSVTNQTKVVERNNLPLYRKVSQLKKALAAKKNPLHNEMTTELKNKAGLKTPATGDPFKPFGSAKDSSPSKRVATAMAASASAAATKADKLSNNKTLSIHKHDKGLKKPWDTTSDKYVPFQGSVVEWKMRESANNIKHSVSREGKRYRFPGEE